VAWRLDDDAAPEQVGLLLRWGAPDPRRAFLRRLPLVGLLVPPQQQAAPGVPATYRIQLRAATADSCAAPPCYQAVLLDAAQ
jgi:hypothetical protein